MADLSEARQARHFAALYRDSDDPWSMRARWYEQRKRALTLACLPQDRYASGFEPGCANGELSAALATRCERLLVSDFNATAVTLARQRLAACAQVSVAQLAMPQQWPQGQFDLIVISELGYYLSPASLDQMLDRIMISLSAQGTLLACHWRHCTETHGQNAASVHAAISARAGLHRLVSHLEDDFMLEVWSRDPRSVAQREAKD